MKRLTDTVLGLLALDLTLIVLSGGFSILGSVGAAEFLFRIAVALLFLAFINSKLKTLLDHAPSDPGSSSVNVVVGSRISKLERVPQKNVRAIGAAGTATS